MYFTANKSPRTLSESVYEILKRDGINGVPFKGARRPFDHYRPTETQWYIVPSAELPFFKFGKFYFEWADNGKSINAGVICTKGLAPELAVVYPSKKGRRLIMEDDAWAFPAWAFHFAQCRFSAVAGEIKNNLPDAEIKIRLKGSYVDDPGIFDPYTEEKKAFDEYELAVDPANDVFKVAAAVRKAMNLKVLNQVRNEKSFAKAVADIAADSFLWCDVFVGMKLGIAENDGNILAAEEVVSKLLSPLSVFVR
ncbi:MAG: hypothetical protein IKB71_03715 [Lentisphaeria bacterium]|nr:hypothetical protein [Lentisphaeria bacterium]